MPIEDLVFAPDFTPWDYNINAAKVSRLKRIFKNEGCNRSEPSNFILGTISEDVLSKALDLSKLTIADLHSRKDPPMLYLPRFKYIRCANGRSRANALSAIPQLGSWWTVELYTGKELPLVQSNAKVKEVVDLSAEAFGIITENYMNEGVFSHGHICERIVHHRSKDPTEERRWWARLTKNSAGIFRRLLNHPSLAHPLLQLILRIPGMHEGFKLCPWAKIMAAKCDEVSRGAITLVTWLIIY